MIRRRPKIPKTEISRFYGNEHDRRPGDIILEADYEDDDGQTYE